MEDKVERPPFLGDAVENGLHLPWLGHIQRHDDLRLKLLRQRLDIFPGLVVAVGDRKFCA